MAREGIAGQVRNYLDPESNLGRGSKHVAFARVTSILAPLMKVERDSVEKPVLLGIMTVSAPVANPALGPGCYGLYFKGKGVSAAQKAALEEAEKAEKAKKLGKEPNGKEPKDGKDAKSGKKKPDAKPAEKPADDKKAPDGKKQPDGKSGKGDAPKDGGAKPEGEKPPVGDKKPEL